MKREYPAGERHQICACRKTYDDVEEQEHLGRAVVKVPVPSQIVLLVGPLGGHAIGVASAGVHVFPEQAALTEVHLRGK